MKFWFMVSLVATLAGLIAAIVSSVFWFSQEGGCGFVRFYEHFIAAIILSIWLAGAAIGMGLTINGVFKKTKTIVYGVIIAGIVNILMLFVCIAIVRDIRDANYSIKSTGKLIELAEYHSDSTAVGELGRRKETEALSLFCSLIKDKTRDIQVQRNAIFALNEISTVLKKGSKEYEDTFTCLIEIFKSDFQIEPQIKCGAAGILSNICDKRSIQPLLKALKAETDEYARDDIMDALQKIGGSEIADALANEAGTPNIDTNRVLKGSREWAGEKVFHEKPSILWRFKTRDKFWYNSAFVHRDVVYFGTQDGIVYAIDAASGDQVWNYPTNAQVMSRYPAHNGKYIFFGAGYGHVYALDMKTGNLVWKQKIGRTGMGGSPCIIRNTVVFPRSDGFITALNCKTGDVEWETRLVKGYYVHMNMDSLASDGKIISGIGTDTIYAMNAATGKFLWSKLLKARIDCFNPLAVVDDMIYYIDPVGSGTMCVARKASTGKRFWKYTAPKYVLNNPAGDTCVKNDTLYTVMDDLYALDVKSGDVIWQTNVKKALSYSQRLCRLMVEGGIVLLGTTDRVAAFDVETGGFLWDLNTGGMVYSQPVASNGRIYFGCDDATLYCLGYGHKSRKMAGIRKKGPIHIEKKRQRYRYLMHDNQLYAWRKRRTSVKLYCLDFDQRKVVYSHSLSGANLVWSGKEDTLWAAGVKIGVCEVKPKTGELVTHVFFDGPGLTGGKIVRRAGNVILAQTQHRKTSNEIAAIDVSTGGSLWEMQIGPDMSLLKVTGAIKRFYISQKTSRRLGPLIMAVDSESGEMLWKTQLAKPVDMLTTAIEKNGTMYLGCNPPAWRYTPVFAIDVETGKLRWQADVEGNDTYVVTADEKALYVTNFSEGMLIAFDVKSGDLLWREKGYTAFMPEAVLSTPRKQPLFLQKDNVTVVAVNRKTGAILAEEPFPEKIVHFDIALHHVFILSEKGKAWMLSSLNR